jgi:outer membrane lipoprotein SlyB
MMQRVILGAVIFLAGCAATTPVLSPSAHLQQVGPDQARRDISECKDLADRSVQPLSAERVARDAALEPRRGETIGITGRVLTGAPAPSPYPPPSGPIQGTPAWQGFVSRCLQERGYNVTGWEE